MILLDLPQASIIPPCHLPSSTQHEAMLKHHPWLRDSWQALALLIAPPHCWSCGQWLAQSTSIGCCQRCLSHCNPAQQPWGWIDHLQPSLPYFAPLQLQTPTITLLRRWQGHRHGAWGRYVTALWWHHAQVWPALGHWLEHITAITCLQRPDQPKSQHPATQRWAQAIAKRYQRPWSPLPALMPPFANGRWHRPQAKLCAPGALLVCTPILWMYQKAAYLRLQQQLGRTLYLLAIAQQIYCPLPHEPLHGLTPRDRQG